MTGRSVRRRAAACLAILGVAAVGLEEPLARFEDWQAARALRGLPGFSVASLTREPGTGRLVLRDVGFVETDGQGGIRVDIGRLALGRRASGPALVGTAAAGTADALAGAARAAGAQVDPSRSGADRPAAGDVDAPPPPPAAQPAAPAVAAVDPSVTVADDVRIAARGHVYRLPHLELRGTQLGAADLAGLLDPAQPATLADRLSRFSATVVQAPELVIAGDPAGPTPADPAVTLHGLVLTSVVAGRIGSLAVDRVTMVERASADAGSFGTGPIRADAVDLPLAASLLSGARLEAATPPEPVFASATLEALAVGGAGRDDVTLGALRIGALRARPLPPSLDRTRSLASRPSASLSPEERGALAGGIADLAESYAVDHIELVDLRFRDGATPGTGFGLARVTLDGAGGRRDLSMSLDGATLESPDAHLALEHFALWGVDQGSLIGLARRLASGGTGEASARPTRAAMALDGLAITVPAKDRGGNDAGGPLIRVAIPEIGFTADRAATGTTTATAHLRIVAPLPAHYSDPQLAGLGALGLSRIDVATDYDAAYDPAAQRLSLGRFAVRAAGLGGVTFGAVLDHVAADPAVFGTDPEAGAQAAGSIAVQSASVRFVNEGIVEKALPLLAASADVSLPVFKASLKAQAAVMIARSFGDSPTATELNQAVSTFVDDPRSFSLALAFPVGRTLGALQAMPPEALARDLTVTATANR